MKAADGSQPEEMLQSMNTEEEDRSLQLYTRKNFNGFNKAG